MTTITATTNYWTATATAVALVTPPPHTVETRADAGPFNFTLTREERLVKSRQHKFGLCDSCDTGLNDRADFHCYFNDTKMTLTCNACDSYFGGGAS